MKPEKSAFKRTSSLGTSSDTRLRKRRKSWLKPERAQASIKHTAQLTQRRRSHLEDREGNDSSGQSQLNQPASPLSSKNRSVLSWGLAARQAEQKKAQRRRLLSRLLAMLVSLGVVASLGWVVFFSPLLALSSSKIRVMGSGEAVTGEDIHQVLSDYVGTPLLRLSKSQLSDQILAFSPWISAADISREYPNGLAVRLTLHQAVAQSENGQVVADDGTLLDPVGQLPDKATLPLIVNSCKTEQLTKCYLQGVQVAAALDQDLRAQLDQIVVTRLKNTNLTLNSGAEVIWGDSTDNQKKAEVLKLLLANRSGSTYNVSDYGHPVVGS